MNNLHRCRRRPEAALRHLGNAKSAKRTQKAQKLKKGAPLGTTDGHALICSFLVSFSRFLRPLCAFSVTSLSKHRHAS
jgi:hypothetical protein